MTLPDEDDPRLNARYVAAFGGSGGTGTVTLVGTVHDHPASIYRVRHVVTRAGPDVVALELPPLAVPLYESYATEDDSFSVTDGSSSDVGESPTTVDDPSSIVGDSHPAVGGEMSAAIGAAPTADVVGIDGPSLGFVRVLVARLVRERASLATGSRSLRSLASVTKTALACRVASVRDGWTRSKLVGGLPTDHETSGADPPEKQAEDERRQIRTATAVMDAFELPPSSRYCTESRERYMASKLAAHRKRGDVVAVVGAGHFDSLCDRLESR